ncbi:MAG: hypothetical protein ACI4RD_09360 [Kiritimatiellia bacterium]
MNKTRIILAATGGVIALVVLVMAVLTWLAFSARTAAFEGDDETEGLESAVGRVAGLMAKKPFPSAENRKRLEENVQTVATWCSILQQRAAVGDWCADAECTPAQFKEQIAKDAKAMLARTGGAATPIVKPDFTFGPFKDYLADKMPARDQLARLQRQWFDIVSLVDILATNGVAEITGLQLVERKAEADGGKPAKGARAKKPAKKSASAASDLKPPSVETYRLSFLSSPQAFAAVVAQLSFQERFTVVDSFGFVREHDAIAEAFDGGDKKEGAAAAGGRRGRRRGARVEEPAAADKDKEGGKRNAVVFDPETDAVLKVELTVSVYDFRSLEDDDGKGASK